LSETAQYAHVVLPSAQWAEEDGTLTNLEGRVLMRRRAIDPPDGVRTDIDILLELGRRLGHRKQFTYSNTESIFDELRRATRGGDGRNPSGDCISDWRGRRRSRRAQDASRHGNLHREDDDDNSRGYRVRAVSLGRRSVGEQSHKRGAGSDEQDA